MSNECGCDCQPVDLGDCGMPGGTLIDPSGVTTVEPTGVYGCVAEDIAEPLYPERTDG